MMELSTSALLAPPEMGMHPAAMFTVPHCVLRVVVVEGKVPDP